MSVADAMGICVQVWEGTPAAALAGAFLMFAIVESPPERHRRRPRAGAALIVAAAALFVACGALTGTGLVLAGVLALAGALGASAGAVWLRRDAERLDDGGGGGGGGRREPDTPSPESGIDWDEFERDFAAYASARVR